MLQCGSRGEITTVDSVWSHSEYSFSHVPLTNLMQLSQFIIKTKLKCILQYITFTNIYCNETIIPHITLHTLIILCSLHSQLCYICSMQSGNLQYVPCNLGICRLATIQWILRLHYVICRSHNFPDQAEHVCMVSVCLNNFLKPQCMTMSLM